MTTTYQLQLLDQVRATMEYADGFGEVIVVAQDEGRQGHFIAVRQAGSGETAIDVIATFRHYTSAMREAVDIASRSNGG